ncbi:MAG: type II secretion system major pseudopilin GspG [Kiritimatiellae bacterium]|jgi:general secretion pathway protein G|nr:type II secretion system major pseudopilin GspG [Kiritimatiellia bacterium]
MTRKHQHGFSLIEVLVALVIIAIMGSVVALNLVGTTDEAKITSTRAEIDTLASALTLYQSQQGTLPTQQQGLEALVRAPTSSPTPPRYPQGGYLTSREVPTDAWGRPYIYLTPGRENEPFELISYGADGLEGGTGPHADLSCAD